MRLFPQGSSLDLLPDAFCFLDVGLLQYLAIQALGIRLGEAGEIDQAGLLGRPQVVEDQHPAGTEVVIGQDGGQQGALLARRFLGLGKGHEGHLLAEQRGFDRIAEGAQLHVEKGIDQLGVAIHRVIAGDFPIADPLPQSLQPIRHGSDAAVNRLIRHMLANDGLQFAQRGIGELLLGDQHVAEALAARGDDAAGQAALALQFVNQAADRAARSQPFAVEAGIAQLIVALDQAVDGEERQGQQKHHQQPRGIAPDRRQAVLGDPWGGGLQPVV